MKYNKVYVNKDKQETLLINLRKNRLKKNDTCVGVRKNI